jgi:hypothetical protein
MTITIRPISTIGFEDTNTIGYQAVGGIVELELFPGMPHGFAREPGPESTRALALMQACVARQLAGAGSVW